MGTIETELIKKRDERGRKITARSEREALVRAYQRSELTAPVAMIAPSTALEVQLPDGTTLRGGNAEELARLLRLVRC